MLSFNAIFTAELAESAENKHHFTMLAGFFRCLRCDLKQSLQGGMQARAVKSRLNNNERISNRPQGGA